MSEDDYTEVTHTSYGSRLKDAMGAIVTGFLLFVAAFPLLFWNEGRAVKTYLTLEEGASKVVTVAPDKTDPQNNGKLVHLTGEATTKETIRDNDFGIALNAIALKRTVEMYQWEESKNTKTEKKLGGGEKKVTTYSYSRT